jgi:DNA-binding protein YbaB
MPDERWGFEEDDGYEDAPDRPAGADVDQVEGTDEEQVVTVVADLAGQALAVRLAPAWAEHGPTSLPQRVITAANAATTAALARQLETPAEPEPEPPAAVDGTGPAGDPFAAINDVLRLMDEVSADLDSFQRRLAAATTGVTSADSRGRHVTVGIRDGQVIDVSVDPRWAAAVRTSEVESELLDALQRAQRMASPGELAQGPRSAAITELNNLVRNPQAMLRQLGLGR